MNMHDSFQAAPPFVPEEPTPLLRPIPPGEPFPVDALGPLREVAEAVRDVTQAPPPLPAQSALGVAALAVQGFADVETLSGSPAPCSLVLLTIAQSGERKTTCDRLLMRPVTEYERELADEHHGAAARHRNRKDVWEMERKDTLQKKKQPDEARADLDALGPEPEGPLLPDILSKEPTFEGIAKNLAQLRAAIGVFSDEGGGFIGGHAMNRDNRLKTMAGMSAMWDGTPVNRTRAGDGVATFYGRRLACHLQAQPVVAAELLADPVALAQGFLPRFLVTEPASTIGTRLRHGYAPESDAALARFSDRVAELLRAELPLREGKTNELAPPVLGLEPDARELLQLFADAVEQAKAPGGVFESIRPFASKAAEHAARIAGVLTLFADRHARSVSGETMRDAVVLVTHYLREARRVMDAAVVTARTEKAELLRVWLLESWTEPFISAGDAVRRGPNAIRETAMIRTLLAVLEAHGWVVPVEGGATVRGEHRREAWRIVRGGTP